MDFVPSETSEQIRLASWLDRHGVVWEHIANEGRRAPTEGRKLRMMGLKAGSADVHISSRVPTRPDVRGIRIELKRQGGRNKATKLQLHRLMVLERDCGYLGFVCYGADHAIQVLLELGFGCPMGNAIE